MKIRPFLAMGLIVAALIGMNSCGKNSITQPASGLSTTTTGGRTTSARSSVVVPFSSSSGLAGAVAAVASYHNSGMSYVYGGLNTSLPNIKVTSNQIAQQVVNAVVSISQNYVNGTFGLPNGPSFPAFNIFGPNYHYFDYTLTTVPAYLQSQTGTTLSVAASSALNTLQHIITAYNDPTSISTQCSYLAGTVLPSLSSTSDTILVLGAIDVAVNSASYWYNSSNMALWQAYSTKISSTSPALALSFAGDPEGGGGDTTGTGSGTGEIVKEAIFSDLVGAGYGAIHGAVVGGGGGTLVVPGVGTVTGAAAGGLWGMASGAVAASVTDGLKSAIRRWIGW